MPGIVTHYVFGTEVYEQLADTIGGSSAEKDAFLLGNQGPDPLLCLKYLPQRSRHRKLGSTMHRRCTGALLDAFHEAFATAAPGEDRRALRAYALGFLCHFLLDSAVHPLVYAQQYAIADAGVEGLPESRKGVVHAAIETELDEYVLWTHCGLTVGGFVPHRQALACSRSLLACLSRSYVGVVKSTYGVEIPKGLFASSVRLYRRVQGVFDSGRDGLRRRLDYARLSGVTYQQVQAMTHRDCARDETPYANAEHMPWPHPFALGAVVDDDFDELYERAFSRACSLVPRFAQTVFASQDCQKLTLGVNFQGKPIGRMPAR